MNPFYGAGGGIVLTSPSGVSLDRDRCIRRQVCVRARRTLERAAT